ncbi:MAG: response regulator [Ramlibacter sp.]|nr:response regulator [Ramlibacter sp.]
MSALRKVLVVDDDPVVGMSFKRVLSGKGYAVITAENGLDGLERMQSEKFDVVFTDLRMPGLSGLDVAEKVKERQPWVPVVIVTGYGSKPSEDRARAAGVCDFLNKPLSPEMIEQSTQRALLQAAPEAVAAPVAQLAPPATEAPPEKKRNLFVNMALFLSAPFIGLLYAVLLPFVGMGLLAWTAVKTFRESRQAARQAEPPVAIK